MNTWMNDERERIARQYVHDMIRSFVAEREPEGLKMTAVYAPDIERLLEIACCCDNYVTKHKELNPFCTNDYYDIDGHCVHSLNGTVTIIFNGVSIQQKEYAERMKLGVGGNSVSRSFARQAQALAHPASTYPPGPEDEPK